MKLDFYINKNKQKKIKTSIIIIVFICLIISTIYYINSYAIFKTSDTHNFIDAKIDFFESQEFAYIGNVQEFIVPRTGYYNIELWGASGGYGVQNGTKIYDPGSGAYTSGIVFLEENEKLYFYVGGSGSDATSAANSGGAGGYNGGGARRE